MTGHIMLSAAITLKDLKSPGFFELWSSDASGFRQLAIIFGAIFLVALAILIWAVFIRKPRPSSVSGRGLERGTLLTNEEMKGHRNRRTFFGKRRKHRRRRAPSRNPTLAETGGLPPIREDAPSEDSAP